MAYFKRKITMRNQEIIKKAEITFATLKSGGLVIPA